MTDSECLHEKASYLSLALCVEKQSCEHSTRGTIGKAALSRNRPQGHRLFSHAWVHPLVKKQDFANVKDYTVNHQNVNRKPPYTVLVSLPFVSVLEESYSLKSNCP